MLVVNGAENIWQVLMVNGAKSIWQVLVVNEAKSIWQVWQWTCSSLPLCRKTDDWDLSSGEGQTASIHVFEGEA